jgi:hypothetical protein
VSVGYATSNGTALAGSDYTAASGTLNFAPGTVTQTIVVPIADDAIFEAAENFTVTLSAPTNATIATATGTGTITDNDMPTVSVSSVSVTEGADPHAVFTVSLSNPSSVATTFDLTLADGTATFPDYGPDLEISEDGGATWNLGTSFTFLPSVTSVLVRTAIGDDAVSEPVENFALTATRTAGATANASATGTATITDNDGTPSLSINDVTVNEAAGTATFTVTLSGPSALTVTADFGMVAGTATDGADYTGVTGGLSFAPGVLTQTIDVPILDDATFEGSENYSVILSNAVNATISDDTGLGTILDDGTGAGGTDDDTPTLTVSSPSVTEGASTHAVFTASLSNASTTPVTVNLALADGSATAADYGAALEISTDGGATWSASSSVTFVPSVTSVLVRTTIADDALSEASETFTLTATRTAGATTNASATGTATILDNDATPAASIDSVTVNESAGTATFTVTLSNMSGLPVSVAWATSNGTATAGSDYTGGSGVLNFAPGVVSQTIVVPILDDATFENSESFTVTLSAPTNAVVAVGTGTGTITDDDTPTIAVSSPSVTEGTDPHAVFAVTLSNPSSVATTVNLALANGTATAADYGPALEVSTDGGATWSVAGSATFAAGTTSVLVRTPITNDLLDEFAETFTLTATRTAGTTTNASATGTATIADDDATPTLSIDNVTVNEAAGTATFTVTLSAASGLAVAVDYATGDLTALAAADYTAAAGTLNFAPGIVSQTIVVPITNDAIFENSENFNVTLSAPSNATIASGTGLGTIRDDGGGTGGTDDDTPTLTVSSPVVVEGTDPYAFFAVSIGNPATVPISFNLALADGSATAADYGPGLEVSTDGGATWSAATSATIAAGSTSVLVRTPITDDLLDEAAETFTLTATRTAGPTTNASALGTATIADDDATPSLSIDSVTVNEAAGTATFTVTLSAPSGQAVSVSYATSDGSAAAGSDYTAASGTLNFAAGVVSQTIVVPITNDATFELSETFAVTLSAPTSATIATPTGTGTILDNDTPTLAVSNASVTEGTSTHAVFAITLSNPSTQATTVNLALADGTATAADYGPALEVSTDGGATWTAGTSVTFAPSVTSVLARTPITDDALNESTENFTLTATVTAGTTSNASAVGTASISDNDGIPTLAIDSVTVNEAAGTATFTVTLSAPSGQPVSVNFATSNGTATSGADFTSTSGTLNFALGVVSQTIVVPITNDTIFEGSETFNVTLSAPTNATIATGTGVGTIRDDGTGTGGTDNDTPTLAVSNAAVTEGTDTHGVFAVTLSNPSAQATTVNLALANGSATGADYGPGLQVSTDGGTTWSAASAATIGAGSMSVLVRTPIVNDALDEAAETFTLTATRTSGTTTNASATGTATITDDDATPSLTINDVTVNEAAGTLVFTVSLSAPSGQTVTVDFATTDGTATAGTDYTAMSGTLTFAPGSLTQTIAVPIANDTLFENVETFTMNLSNPTNASVADAIGAGAIRDDGTGGGGVDNDTPTLAVGNVSVLEGTDTHAVFAITLSNPSTTAVTANLALANGTATAADFGPGLEVSTDGGTRWTAASSATFAPGATSILARTPLLDDALTESPETFTLTATVASGTTTNASAAGTATIVDDEAPPAMAINDVTVNEAAGTATFTVTLNRASTSAISANFTTGNVTALAGADYVATAGTVNFAPGQVSQTITVSILDDTIFETSESFDLILSAAVNATIADNTGTGTIRDDGTGSGGTDDDTPSFTVSSPTASEGGFAVFTVSLSNPSTTPVTLALALVNGTATAADFGPGLQVSTNGGATWTNATTATIAPGQTSVLVRTPLATDALREAPETFTLTATLTSGAATNANATGTATILDVPAPTPPPPPPFVPPSKGFEFQYDTFNNFSENRSEPEAEPLAFQRLVRSIEVDRPALLPLAPIYSGEADPGATLVIDIYNAKGERIGSQTVVADSGGNWLATFPTTTLRDAPNTARVTQFAPTYSMDEKWGHNLRTYFTPALNAGHFSLDIRGGADLSGEAAPLLSGLALEDPLQLGAVKYGGEFLTRQATASGR